MNVLLARIEDALPIHYYDCDSFQVYDHGIRQGKCDCTANEDVRAIIARVREATDLLRLQDTPQEVEYALSILKTGDLPAGRKSSP